MHEDPVDPEDCLRSLTAQALLRADPDRPLFPASLGLMAVANAFVMLGLLPEPRAEAILAEHRMALERRGLGNVWGVTNGELTVRPGAHEYWESRMAGPASTAAGSPARIPLPSPAQVPVGTTHPPWPAPAECYLAALAPVASVSIATSDTVAEAGPEETAEIVAPVNTVAEAGPEETAEIVATVADSLMAVGALPVTSTLLRAFPGGGPGWHTALAHRWGSRARQRRAGFRAAEHRGLMARLPLDHATAVIESVSAQGDLVSIQLYGHPWVHGEYWPMITPCFQVRATDDAGDEHEGWPSDWRSSGDHEGSGNFWFWPPVPSARKSIRVTVSTLWEAAWAEIELPR